MQSDDAEGRVFRSAGHYTQVDMGRPSAFSRYMAGIPVHPAASPSRSGSRYGVVCDRQWRKTKVTVWRCITGNGLSNLRQEQMTLSEIPSQLMLGRSACPAPLPVRKSENVTKPAPYG